MMEKPDLNLLFTLEALLSEGSVAGAAKRLRLSSSAMSRSLTRLRQATGDPLLVRAGRGLVPTPRALALRESVSRLVHESEAALRPAKLPDPAGLARTFTLRSTEGFVENFGAAMLARVEREAPGVRVHFALKANRESASLRDGEVDLDIGVVGGPVSPEMHTRALFRDRFVGVVRADHPWAGGTVSLDAFTSARHIAVHRHGGNRGPVDTALASLGRSRDVHTLVAGFTAAIALAKATDMIATVPERHSGNLLNGVYTFPIPAPLPEFTISMIWHPRQHADPAHQWLRECVRDVCSDRAD